MNRRCWFPLTRDFWGLETEEDRQLAEMQRLHAESNGGSRPLSQDRLVNEQYLSFANKELRTYKLSKAYEKTTAVKEVTLKMHQNEVFCLLGHNGAGTS
jgi:ATPase subunit of ABC transporter with duplicated ATPase domains